VQACISGSPRRERRAVVRSQPDEEHRRLYVQRIRFTNFAHAGAGRIEETRVKGAVRFCLSIRSTSSGPPLHAGERRHRLRRICRCWSGVCAQYVERAPRAPKLLSRGIHEATETFDIGNPNLKIEAAKTVEIGIRKPRGPFRFEATAFYTRYSNFIFRNLTGFTCDETIDTCDDPINGGAGGDLNQAVYAQRDATFRGGEFQSQLDVAPIGTGTFGIENQFDVVRATFARQCATHSAGACRRRCVLARCALAGARQPTARVRPDRVAMTGETATDGYNLLKAEIVYTTPLRPTISAPVLPLRVSGNACSTTTSATRVVQEGRGADAGAAACASSRRSELTKTS
jgi:hypothetical protein